MHLFSSIIRTILTKGLSSVISFLIVIITARCMGADGRGDISLTVLNLTVIVLFSDLIGGGALVYLIPRHSFYSLMIPTWIWGILCGVAGTLIIYAFTSLGPLADSWEPYGFCLTSIFLNLYNSNCVALNGKEKIQENNIVSLVQVLSLLIFLITGIFILDKRTVDLFYLSLLGSYGLSFLLSLFFLLRKNEQSQEPFSLKIISVMFQKGLALQLGNAVQLMNYRVALYFLYHFQTKAMVGIYSTGASVCESVWVIANGISMVLYARIANMKDKEEAINLSVWLSKISFLATVAALLVILAIPAGIFGQIFGPDFISLPLVILLLSGGIALFGLSCIYSHYFSGMGRLQEGSYSSIVGFVVTVCMGFMLIPRYGITGAAITASASYTASTLYLLVRFKVESRKSWFQLLGSYTGIFNFARNLKTNVRDKRDH